MKASTKRLPYWLRQYRVCVQYGRPKFGPWAWKIPWRWKWQPSLVFLPRKFHGLKSLEGYNPGGHKELGMTEQLTLDEQNTKVTEMQTKPLRNPC